MGKKLSLLEFIVLMALMFSLIAYATDAMLPAFERIALDLKTQNVSRVQLIIAFFVLGTGIGQLIAGPLSDTLGRKPVILGGILFFILASIWASATSSLEMLLLERNYLFHPTSHNLLFYNNYSSNLFCNRCGNKTRLFL